MLYFSMSASVHARMKDPSGWSRLLHRFMDAPLIDEDRNAKAIHDRLKMIARIVNVDDLKLGGFERKLVDTKNAQPVLTRPQHRFFKSERYFEVDFDVHMMCT